MLYYEKNCPEFCEKYFQAKLVKVLGIRHEPPHNTTNTGTTNKVNDNSVDKTMKPE